MNRRGFQKSARGFYFVPLMSVFSKPRTRDDNACHVSLARRPIGWCRPAYHAQMHVSVPLRVHGGGEIQRDLSVTLTGTRHKALTSARTSLYALNWLALGRRTVVSAGAPAPWPKPPPHPPVELYASHKTQPTEKHEEMDILRVVALPIGAFLRELWGLLCVL